MLGLIVPARGTQNVFNGIFEHADDLHESSVEWKECARRSSDPAGVRSPVILSSMPAKRLTTRNLVTQAGPFVFNCVPLRFPSSAAETFKYVEPSSYTIGVIEVGAHSASAFTSAMRTEPQRG